MTKRHTLTTDLFIVPYKDDNQLLYAPRRGFLCAANQDLVSLLANLDALDFDQLNPDQQAALNYLEQKGLFNNAKEYDPITPVSETFAPNQLTLFPTNQCNLRCLYCYASAGEYTPIVIDWHYCVSAIEFMVRNLKDRGIKYFSLGFHGGGEPLYPWALIKKVVSYAEERCQQEGLELAVFSATNGILNEIQLEWIVQHFKNLNISFDGLPHVQDYHRPLINGKGSFALVDRTMRYLDEKGFRYGIRGTVSNYNVQLMPETIEFIGQNYKVKSVHLEPLYYCGRCRTNDALCPEMDVFAENFVKCEDICLKYGINLIYSGSHVHILHNSFCGVSGSNFSVTPDGYLTTCYEVTEVGDPRSDTFFFGRIDEQGQVLINEEKRTFLNQLTVDKLGYCADCYGKWHCAGECAAKLDHRYYLGDRGHERCILNRSLIAHRLQRMVEGKSLVAPANRHQ